MSKPFFTPEDFNFIVTVSSLARRQLQQEIANTANAKLEAALGPVVYGYDCQDGYMRFVEENFGRATHTARLLNVQPISSEKALTHESMLAELVQLLTSDEAIPGGFIDEAIGRARKLLEGSGAK